MSRKKRAFILLLAIVVVSAGIYIFAGIIARDGFDPKNPVVLTLWHNPTGQDPDALSAAVDRFNRSVGRERGIFIIVTSIAKAELLHEKLASIAMGNPGAPEPPDMAIAYPKSVFGLISKEMLAPFDDYFTDGELAAYVPSFIESGRLNGGKLYLFPVGKSTEGLIINRTFWDQFSADTGTPLSELSTFEGIVRTAEKYYEWTDAKTPDIGGDGLAFFIADNPFNVALTMFAQMGESLFAGGGLNTRSPIYGYAWKFLFEPAVRGYEAVYKGYGSDMAKTGKVMCWIGSTAGITFVTKNVIYDDNTSEPVEFDILPYPLAEGGKQSAIQRGGGICLFKSDALKQKAAAIFLKWLTEPAGNLRYLEGTGYMPVTAEAVKIAGRTWGKDASGIWKSYIDMMKVMNGEYTFLTQPPLENYGELEIFYENRVRKISVSSREKYLENLMYGEALAWERATESAYEKFVE